MPTINEQIREVLDKHGIPQYMGLMLDLIDIVCDNRKEAQGLVWRAVKEVHDGMGKSSSRSV